MHLGPAKPGYNHAMRYWMAMAALVAVLLGTPAWAQMRGGHIGAPARPGVAFHGPAMSHGPITVNRSPGFAPRPQFGGNFHQPFFPHRLHHHHRVFFPYVPWLAYYGYPAYYGGYSYPLDWASSSYENQNDSYSQQNYQLQQQVNELSNEVAQLRGEQEAFLSRPLAPAAPSAPPQPRAAEKSSPPEPTTLVFRDGRSEQVQNYAVVGHTLWIFSEQRARRIPLSELDLAATQRVNEDRGVDFAVPQQK